MQAILLWLASAWLIAVEVPTTVVRVIDGDTLDTELGRVRLLYVDTPESRDNAHGAAMPEGKAAAAFLAGLLRPSTPVVLWSTGDALVRDRYDRLLAVVVVPDATGSTTAQAAIIRAGWSVLWEKYGRADPLWRAALDTAEQEAKAAHVGAWATQATWMTNKSNETTARD